MLALATACAAALERCSMLEPVGLELTEQQLALPSHMCPVRAQGDVLCAEQRGAAPGVQQCGCADEGGRPDWRLRASGLF